MNSLRSLPGCLLVAVLAALALSGLWLATRAAELHAAETRVAAAVAANHRIVVALRTRETRTRAASEPSPAKSAAGPAQSTDTAVANNFARGSQIQTRLRAMTEYAPHERRELRRQTMRRYADLFSQLHLQTDRQEAFKLILDENYGTSFDAFTALYAQGLTQSSPEFQQFLKRYLDEGEERVRQFLGPEDYRQYQDYEKSAGWRNGQLLGVRCTLTLHGLPPLAADQEGALARAYLEAQSWQPAGPKPPPGALFRMRNDQLGVLARDALAPGQHAALVEYLAFVNKRAHVLGRLLHPQEPDAFEIARSP